MVFIFKFHFSTDSLLVYKNTIDFLILTLYSVVLLNSFISSSSFFSRFLKILQYYQSINKKFYLFLFNI